MKKISISILSVLILLILVGCSKKTYKNDINKERQIENVIITPKKINRKKDDSIKNNKNHLIRLKVNVQNNSKSEIGIGSGDFQLQVGKKQKLNSYGYEDSFGEIIPSKKSGSGNIYFMVPKKQKNYQLIYKRADGKSVSWKLRL